MSSIEFLKWLQTWENPILVTLFSFITNVGSDQIYIIFVAWLYWCEDQYEGEKWANIVLFSALLNGLVKLLVKAPRPFQVPNGIEAVNASTATGHSFPSGHSQASAVFGSSLVLHYKSWMIKGLGIMLFLSVGFSRLYLRVHWPIDVLVGWSLGILVAVLFYFLYEGKDVWFRLGMLAFIGISLYIGADEDQIKLIGLALSSMLGFWLNRRYFRFEVDPFGQGGRRKLFFGILALLATMKGLKLFMPESLDLLRYFAVGLVMTVVYPLIFEFVFSKKKSY